MPFTLPLEDMTWEEKLKAMEDLWQDLSKRPDDLEAPAWHAEVLAERERQVKAGEVTFIPWEQAKVNLRRRAAYGDAP